MSFHGFADPPIHGAHAYRAILDAMAHPGSVIHLRPSVSAPAPLRNSAAAICLVLCDYSTPIWLDPRIGTTETTDFLRFHTGAPIVAEAREASFLICEAEGAETVLSGSSTGSDEYPDRSATLIVQLADPSGGLAVELSGPGVRGICRFDPAGLGPEFWGAMQRNHALFPQGVDVLFAAPDRVAACPRSTSIDC